MAKMEWYWLSWRQLLLELLELWNEFGSNVEKTSVEGWPATIGTIQRQWCALDNSVLTGCDVWKSETKNGKKSVPHFQILWCKQIVAKFLPESTLKHFSEEQEWIQMINDPVSFYMQL